MEKLKERLGESRVNNQDSAMRIVRYGNCSDMDVEFDDGYVAKNVQYGDFKKGLIKTPYNKSVLNVGYLGEGKYKVSIDGKKTNVYVVWKDMLSRCYSTKFKERHSTYTGVYTCNEWHNFQNFGNWYDKNHYEIQEQKIELDKDILIKGNKVYSPSTCVFVPGNINNLFVRMSTMRGKMPIGVSESDSKYRAYCKNMFVKKTVYLGTFTTPKNAFCAYKEYKESHIKQVANKYKDNIPKKLYDAMINWRVEITD